MNLKCLVGRHEWDRCKCRACGKTRDEEHNWASDCETCARCGKVRQNEHYWIMCRCRTCGKTRDEGHDWSRDCKTCARCGKTRDEEHNWDINCERCATCGVTRSGAHNWNGCTCTSCGYNRDKEHSWKGCMCKICGTIGFDGHDFVDDVCTICGRSLASERQERCEMVMRSTHCFYFLMLEWHKRKSPPEDREVMLDCYRECAWSAREACHRGPTFVELSILTDGQYAIAISGYWPPYVGLKLDQRVIHTCAIGADDPQTSERKREYCNLVRQRIVATKFG